LVRAPGDDAERIDIWGVQCGCLIDDPMDLLLGWTNLPLRECSTAFSMNSVMVCDLNLAYEPKEKVPRNSEKPDII